eukprot:TRINITY_DN5183_c0_g1_i3.p1 TRINITY_DN5183_c0_g1~~TRINITY_DN5183_c0_g1_i3.p1  ORF type:complete len:667 (+),score=157.32 TRINITY_DN5183_c0_g1_i3:91-2091(+)
MGGDLEALVEEVIDVVGDEYSVSDVEAALKQASYNVDEAIGILFRGALNLDATKEPKQEASSLGIATTEDQTPTKKMQNSPQGNFSPSHAGDVVSYQGQPSELANVICRNYDVERALSFDIPKRLSILSLDSDLSVKRFTFDTPSPDEVIEELRKARFKRPPQNPVPSSKSASGRESEARKNDENTPSSATKPSGNPPQTIKKATKPTQVATAPTQKPAPTISNIMQRSVARNREISQLLQNTKSSVGAHYAALCGAPGSGKSTLLGQILCKTGHISKQLQHKCQSAAASSGNPNRSFAWILDESEFERKQGGSGAASMRTINTSGTYISLIDTPGRRDFFSEFMAGCSLADTSVFVVPFQKTSRQIEQDDNILREQLTYIRSAGISRILVIINVFDESGWSFKQFSELTKEFYMLAKQCGFQENQLSASFCNAVTGLNIMEKTTEPTFGSIPTVIDLLTKRDFQMPTMEGAFRLSIFDVFKNAASGIVVSGRIDAGILAVGDQITTSSQRQVMGVKAISAQDASVQLSRAGEVVDVIVTGIDANNLSVGDVLCDPERPLIPSMKILCRVLVVNPAYPLTKGTTLLCISKTQSSEVVVERINSSKELSKSAKSATMRYAKGGDRVDILVASKTPIHVDCFAENKSYGRIGLIQRGFLAAVGVVMAK